MNKLNFTRLFFVASLLFTSITHAQIITTVAGDSIAGYGGDGGQATACELNGPTGICFDSAGNYYIAARYEARIRKVAPDGIITTIAGDSTSGFRGDNGPATAAELDGPYGVAIDRAGNIYFGDNGNNRIRKINTAGIITTVAGNGVAGYIGDNIPATEAELNGVGSVAVDNSGNIYANDYANNRIRKISTTGIITTIAGTGTAGYNGDGIPATNAELHSPNWVALDNTGNVYIADQYNERIRKIDTFGIIHTVAGTYPGGYSGDNGPATDAKLSSPLAVCADNIGNIYIGDTYNNVVRMVNTSGIITTIAGDTVQGYSGDGGKATLAELSNPIGVATDANYNLYIADFGNARVRMVTSTVGIASPGLATTGEVTLWPNPCNGNFTISISTNVNEQANITISDLLGKIIKATSVKTNTPQNISFGAPDGIYLLKAVTSNGLWTKRIVIKKCC